MIFIGIKPSINNIGIIVLDFLNGVYDSAILKAEGGEEEKYAILARKLSEICKVIKETFNHIVAIIEKPTKFADKKKFSRLLLLYGSYGVLYSVLSLHFNSIVSIVPRNTKVKLENAKISEHEIDALVTIFNFLKFSIGKNWYKNFKEFFQTLKRESFFFKNKHI